jgi:mono/diheme cytochrome c family protein
MSMIRLFALIALLSSAVPGPASGQESSEPEVAPVRSVLSGVYTAAQATRGEAQFKQNCAACHTTGEFSSVAFRRAWSGRTIYDLFEMVRTLMPYDSPGSLSRESYAEILAYFLELNGYPAGDVELPADGEAQKLIRIERKPEATGT